MGDNKTATGGLDGYVQKDQNIISIHNRRYILSTKTLSRLPNALLQPRNLLFPLSHTFSYPFLTPSRTPFSHPNHPFSISSRDDGSVASGLRSRSAPLTRNLSHGALSTTSSKAGEEQGQGLAQGQGPGGRRAMTDRVNLQHQDDADNNSAEISLRKDELEYALHIATGLVSAINNTRLFLNVDNCPIYAITFSFKKQALLTHPINALNYHIPLTHTINTPYQILY